VAITREQDVSHLLASNRRKNDTASAPGSFFMNMAPAPELMVFMCVAPAPEQERF